MAAAGAPLRSLMEWMGHSNIQTTLIYADYVHDAGQGAALAARAFAGFSRDPLAAARPRPSMRHTARLPAA
jgi:hypothetical protein